MIYLIIGTKPSGEQLCLSSHSGIESAQKQLKLFQRLLPGYAAFAIEELRTIKLRDTRQSSRDGKCRHCGKLRYIRARGLCDRCSRKPKVACWYSRKVSVPC